MNKKNGRRILSSKEEYYNEDHVRILIDFASVWSRISWESIWQWSSFGISLIVFWEDKTFLPSKTLCIKFMPSHLFIGLRWPFTKPMKRCDYWHIFWKLFTGNRLQCLCNRLHSYNLKGHDFWIWISGVSLLVIDYMLKIQIHNLFQQLFLNPVFW